MAIVISPLNQKAFFSVNFQIKKHLSAYSLPVLIGIFILLVIGLDGGRPFATPDEARYVEIPREMIKTGDFITPRLNAMKYFEKPPLFYWIQAAVMKCFGMSEGVMRLSVMLSAFLGILLMFSFVKRFIDKPTALWTGVVLATSGLYYVLSRLIIIDMTFTLFITGAFTSFYHAFFSHERKRRMNFYGFVFFCAMGILTKGIVSLALVGPAILLWLTVSKQWKNLFPLYLPTCLLLFLALIIPWHALAHLKNPDFLHKYFYVEHFLRYTTTVHSRYQPVWFFIPILLVSVIPWLGAICHGFFIIKKENRTLFLYLSIWAGWILFFYSFSNSKLVPYILPVLPPLAVFGGAATYTWYKKNLDQYHLSKLGIYILGVIGVVGGLLPFVAPTLFIGCEEIIPYTRIVSLIFIGLSVLLFFNNMPKNAVKLHLFAAVIFIILTNITAPHIQKTSVKPLAEWIVLNKKENDYVVSFKSYFQDLPFYTKTAPVVCVDEFNELDFGMDAEPDQTKEWMLTSAEFIKKFKPGSKKTFWAVSTKSRFETFKKKVTTWQLKIAATHQELILFYHKG